MWFQHQYPLVAARTPAQVRADPNGQLAAAWKIQPMPDSLAYILAAVLKSAELFAPHPIPFSPPTDCDDDSNLLGRRRLCGLAVSSGFMLNFRQNFTPEER